MNSVQTSGQGGSSGKKDSLEELAHLYPAETRNWRGIIFSLIVICVVLSLICMSIIILTPEIVINEMRTRRITLNDITSSYLKLQPYHISWTKNHELIHQDSNGDMYLLNTKQLTTHRILTSSQMTTINQSSINEYQISPNLKYLLIASKLPNGSRLYTVLNKQTLKTVELLDAGRSENGVQYAVWSPSSTALNQFNDDTIARHVPHNSGDNDDVGLQAIAFVVGNNLYFKPHVEGERVFRLTDTGEFGNVYNAITDWLYENTPELVTETLLFSGDGRYLSFMSFDDTNVEAFQYSFIGENRKYPELRYYRCPISGGKGGALPSANGSPSLPSLSMSMAPDADVYPNVTVFVVSLSSNVPKLMAIELSDENGSKQKSNAFYGGMVWPLADELSFTVTDAKQMKSTTVICVAPNFRCREIFVETKIDDVQLIPNERAIFYCKRPRWATALRHAPLWANAPQRASFFLRRMPVRDGEHGYYRHVVLVSVSDMRTVPLTMGRYEVTEILGWDEANGAVYFMVAPENKPGERHLYRVYVNINSTESRPRVFVATSQPYCLTCDNSPYTFRLLTNLSEDAATAMLYQRADGETIPNNCLYNRVHFSVDFTSYVQECLGPEAPTVYLVDTQTNTKVLVLHDGEPLRERLQNLSVPLSRTFSVEVRHGFQAQVRLLLPHDINEEETYTFPLIVQMDAAPGSQLVSEKFEVDWNWYLSSQRSMIVGQIDVRGSGFQGEQMRSQINGQIGSVEIEDLLGVITYLRDTFPFIDPTRICTYGTGYGGYASAMSLADDSQRVLQCAIAINPIVSFAYQSSYFTDFHIPHQNSNLVRALHATDLSKRALNFDGRNFLLLHSTANTKITSKNALHLSKALIDGRIAFRHQIYPDEDHDMHNVLGHMYKTVDKFFNDSFGSLEYEEWNWLKYFKM